MRVAEFEEAVWKIDHIRVVIRAPHDETVQNFDWVKAAEQGLRLSQYASNRIEPRLNGFKFEIIDGSGDFPNRNTRVGNVRQSYAIS
jgi:hypothetical protein